MIIRKESGFSLVELLITMVVFLFAIIAASNIFSSFVVSSKQQSKIMESGMEGVVGLEILRNDIEQAGFGLAWDLGGINYQEAVNIGSTPQDEAVYNDAPANVPRAFVHGDGEGLNGSDVLVIKATNVAVNDASQRFTRMKNEGLANDDPVQWDDLNDNLQNGDNVVVVAPVSAGRTRALITSVGAFFTTYSDTAAGFDNAFEPIVGTYNLHLIYGINTGAPAPDPRFPFNRADYYIQVPGSIPTQCFPGGFNVAGAAASVGVLYKATVNHADGQQTLLPILDCVADIQIDFARDTDNDGDIDSAGIAGLDAETIRDQVRQVQAYVLAHEGQYDPNYVFTNYTGSPAPPFNNGCAGACNTCVMVGDPSTCTGRNFNLANLTPAGSTRYQNYRWKVYSMVIKPFNLR